MATSMTGRTADNNVPRCAPRDAIDPAYMPRQPAHRLGRCHVPDEDGLVAAAAGEARIVLRY